MSTKRNVNEGYLILSVVLKSCFKRNPPQKCLRFNPDATVWKAKQQVLCSLTESLRDVLNYGLFQPATDGHDAKFLEEERLLKEYPQSFEKGVPYLEVRVHTRHNI